MSILLDWTKIGIGLIGFEYGFAHGNNIDCLDEDEGIIKVLTEILLSVLNAPPT